MDNYNAGQKKRNSELRIFGAPTEGGGSSRELTKSSWIRVAFLLTSIVMGSIN